MIPPIIHYCWFGGGQQSRLLRRCMASWQRVMPDFQVKVWNETNSPLDNAYTRAAYAQKRWSRLSNYVRLHALYREGGIYLDTDVEVIKSFTPLLREKCFAGFQQAEAHEDWVNGAVLGAQAGHQFLQRCLTETVKRFTLNGEFCRGPKTITAVLRELGLRQYGRQTIDEVSLYPTEYFYPYPWFGQFTPECITAETYCVHHWAGSWLKQERRAAFTPRRLMGRMKRALRRAL